MSSEEITEKISFAQVRNQTHFSIVDLAYNAGVHTLVVYKMLLNQPVEHARAVDVLYVLSVMYNGNYNLDVVDVAIETSQASQSSTIVLS